MLVYLAGDLIDHNDDIAYLKTITEAIHDHGAVLAHNWLEAAIAQRSSDIKPPRQNTRELLKMLRNADVAIIDASHYSFEQGFILAAALNYKKPVLVLSRDRLKYKFISGFTNSLIQWHEFATQDDVQKYVKNFLRRNTVHTKDLRFNFFITRKIAQYLEDARRETGMTQSEIIRDIIKKSDHRKELSDV